MTLLIHKTSNMNLNAIIIHIWLFRLLCDQTNIPKCTIRSDNLENWQFHFMFGVLCIPCTDWSIRIVYNWNRSIMCHSKCFLLFLASMLISLISSDIHESNPSQYYDWIQDRYRLNTIHSLNDSALYSIYRIIQQVKNTLFFIIINQVWVQNRTCIQIKLCLCSTLLKLANWAKYIEWNIQLDLIYSQFEILRNV